MFRSSLIFRGPGFDAARSHKLLPATFRRRSEVFATRIGNIPGLRVDLCERNDTKVHMGVLIRKLRALRRFIDEIRMRSPNIEILVSITATNVADPYFTRTIPVTLPLVEILHELQIELFAEVCPCG